MDDTSTNTGGHRAVRVSALHRDAVCGVPFTCLLFCLIGEFLSGHRGFVHEPAFGNSENGHAFLVPARGRRVLLAAARSRGGGALGAGARRGAGGNGDRAHIAAEAEVARRKFTQGSLVLKENDFAVSLAAQLQSDADLGHRCIADVLALLINAATAVSAADADSAFPDRRKNCVSVAGFE